MKALVCMQPGLPEYKEIAAPVLQPEHAIMQIKNTGIRVTDLHANESTQPYFKYPRILGHKLSGELIDFDDALGFEQGEAVTFLPYFNCGTCIARVPVIAMNGVGNRLTFLNVHIGVPYTIHASGSHAMELLRDITGGDLPTVMIDASGNQKAINNGIHYLAHGGRYVLIGLQKNELVVSHPEVHKHEATLLSSRNAIRPDFEHVIASVKKGLATPATYINNVVRFDAVKDNLDSWLHPSNGIMKTIVENSVKNQSG